MIDFYPIIKKGLKILLPVSEELKMKLKEVNQSLKEAYALSPFDRHRIRQRLEEIGSFQRLTKWDHQQLKEWLNEKTMVGVDGSVNSIPENQVRTLSIFQALAKGLKEHEEKWAADVHTPLLEDRDRKQGQAAREARERGTILSELELKVAQEAIVEWLPKLVMMDGSLVHFLIDHAEEWSRLVELVEQHDVFILGVAEEIQSYRLVNEFFPEYPYWSDRDLFYGVLEEGEVFEWEDWSVAGSGLWKMVMRTSKSPLPIGIDGLESQREERLKLASLVYTLTPKQGRGIPYWLDIVDQKVRVTNPLVQTMVEQYIDPDIRHRILQLKREERSI